MLTLEAQIAEGFLELRCAIPFLTEEHFETRGLVSKETLVLPRWGSEARKFFLDLSNIGHRTEIESSTVANLHYQLS